MGILDEFRSLYGEVESPKEEVPKLNVYDPLYIQERIRILKEHPIRNRFIVGEGKVRMSEIDVVTCEVKNVTEVYVMGELCMNRKQPKRKLKNSWIMLMTTHIRSLKSRLTCKAKSKTCLQQKSMAGAQPRTSKSHTKSLSKCSSKQSRPLAGNTITTRRVCTISSRNLMSTQLYLTVHSYISNLLSGQGLHMTI